MPIIVRSARFEDLDALLHMCREHALYERTAWCETHQLERLPGALFCDAPRLYAWVAHCSEELIGYASATIDFSTWSARPYVHLDCLYVREQARARGIGRLLFEAVDRFARAREIRELQWQTPHWNVAAQRFYERLGARGAAKVRFSLVRDT